MSQAIAAAPKHLSPTEKMKWAAAGWRRQTQTRVGGITHPGFKGVAQSIAKREGLPIENANAILAASSRRASVKDKILNPRLKKVKGGRIPIPQREPRVPNARTTRQFVIAQVEALIAESNRLEAQWSSANLSTGERNRINHRINEIRQEITDLYRQHHVQGSGIGSTLLKIAPHILTGIKLAAKIGSRIAADKNQTASDVLDIIGGLGIKRQKQARAKKLTDMRRKQRIR